MSDITPAESLGSFKFCPRCGAGDPSFYEGKRLHCGRCGFEYFHNVATAAGVILDSSGSVVLLERAREPRKGSLGLPGGFVDPGERAEEAALRECWEEIGWAPPSLSILGSFPNSYRYGGVAYNTCDLYFYYRFPTGSVLPGFEPRDGEVSAIRILALAGLRREELAFPSLWRAIGEYKKITCGE
jgi:8-oxo-dGTP pyrophosphatase MutT (NUDIX family)